MGRGDGTGGARKREGSGARSTVAALVVAAASLAATPAGAESAGRATPVAITALGASNTEGYGVAPGEAFPERLGALLRARGIDARVRNAGVGGEPTGAMLARFEAAAPPGTRLLVLQPGTNDERLGFTPAQRGANIAAMTARARALGAGTIVIEDVLAGVPPDQQLGDGSHLNAAGHAALAARLLPLALDALARPAPAEAPAVLAPP